MVGLGKDSCGHLPVPGAEVEWYFRSHRNIEDSFHTGAFWEGFLEEKVFKCSLRDL